MENGGGGGGGGDESINGGRGGGGGGHNGNNWDFWELGSTTATNNSSSSSSSSSRFDWSHHHNHNHQHQHQHQHHHHHEYHNSTGAGAAAHALMISNQVNNAHPSSSHQHQHQYQQYLQQQQSSLYGTGGGGGGVHPDPHLTCLKLGKRHYFEDHGPPPPLQQQPPPQLHVANGFPTTMMIKRGRSFDDPGTVLIGGGSGGGHHSVSPSSTSSLMGSTVVIPRCQVEGCHVALIHAKDYHRRHKVCEMHSKAPKVVVLGIEQRFCQQCSRFHVVAEFDDSKRSCRRRLAGHNERRRKSASSNDSNNVSRNPNQETRSMDGRFSYISPSTGRALSLLSSSKLPTSWVSPADLSTRSSAALRELIAEKRAAVLGKQLLFEQNWHQNGMENTGGGGDHQTHGGVLSQVPGLQHQVFPADPSEWDRFQESDAHVTLDLMQTPSSPFGFLSAGRSNNKSNKDEEEDQCCEIWKSLEGTHVV